MRPEGVFAALALVSMLPFRGEPVVIVVDGTPHRVINTHFLSLNVGTVGLIGLRTPRPGVKMIARDSVRRIT